MKITYVFSFGGTVSLQKLVYTYNENIPGFLLALCVDLVFRVHVPGLVQRNGSNTIPGNEIDARTYASAVA